MPPTARALPALALAATALTACTGTPPAAAPSPAARPTYELPARPVRSDETPLKLPPVRDGETEFTLIGIASGITSISGSHAEFTPKGVYTRVRVSVANNGRSSVLFRTGRQELLAGGRVVTPDYDAMNIRRQPESFTLGSDMRAEFDLWYLLPPGTRPTAMRLYGGASLYDMKDEEGARVAIP
ncbi:hypothetical protein [Bailinhaonella thermotolerans]|uniref:DUF4352 domain-containing protein n=1 Tax=Bailinhaonella thermotolerans TaxID=1070861 RepID=A0A3A4AZD1_9ACTN|nr:hypothetical protein [Bailinhaonella thermotolerans]RJL24732.1 hypothetical protein D5H75_28475 [Bailinhaonella thermotolerans]